MVGEILIADVRAVVLKQTQGFFLIHRRDEARGKEVKKINKNGMTAIQNLWL